AGEAEGLLFQVAVVPVDGRLREGLRTAAADHLFDHRFLGLVLRLFLFVEPHGADDVLAFRYVEQPHARGSAADHAQRIECDTDQLGLVRDQHQLVRGGRGEARYDWAVAGDVVAVGDALAPAAGAPVLVGRADLAVAVGADGEDELFLRRQLLEALRRHLRFAVPLALPGRVAQVILALFLVLHADAVENRERNDLVARLQAHAAHAG